MVIAALDIGGSSVKRGLVTLPDKVALADPVPIDSLAPANQLLDQLADAAGNLLAEDRSCRDLAVAFPQPFDMENGIPLLQGVHKFDSIYGIPLAPVLSSQTDRELRISFCGDAVAAAVGEALAGAGQPYRRVLMVTLGTGFGSALVVDGRPVENHAGNVVEEIHHETVRSRESADESLSAWGLAKRLGLDMADLAAAAEDVNHREAIERYGMELGLFLSQQVPRFEPDVIVIGGGASGALPLFGDFAQREVDVPLMAASLAQRAAVLGAASLHTEFLQRKLARERPA